MAALSKGFQINYLVTFCVMHILIIIIFLILLQNYGVPFESKCHACCFNNINFVSEIVYWKSEIYIYWKSEIYIGSPRYILEILDIYWKSEIYIGSPRYMLEVRDRYWKSKIYIGSPPYRYILEVRDIYWKSKIDIGSPRYILEVRDFNILSQTQNVVETTCMAF